MLNLCFNTMSTIGSMTQSLIDLSDLLLYLFLILFLDIIGRWLTGCSLLATYVGLFEVTLISELNVLVDVLREYAHTVEVDFEAYI